MFLPQASRRRSCQAVRAVSTTAYPHRHAKPVHGLSAFALPSGQRSVPPLGESGWFTKPHPKNGDWRRFAISKQMCQAVQEHIEAFGLGPDDLLFPQWMLAYVHSSPIPINDDEELPPLVSKSGAVYEHGTKGARYSMNCHCRKCKAYAAEYQRQWRHQQRANSGEFAKADSRRRDGTEFLMAEVWSRFWNAAGDASGLPESFTLYNARHTVISWAIARE